MSDPASAGLDACALAQLTTALNRWIATGHIAGAVVLVERRGVLGLFDAIGQQDASRGVAMRRDSIFRIYSMTKPIVSVALMQLAEQGRVLLREPVAKYLPAFAGAVVGVDGAAPKRAPTVHDLLRHTAGLTYEFHEPSAVRQRYADAKLYSRQRTNAQHVELLEGLPLMHEPGSVWDYSRATDVLGRLVEVPADAPLAEYLRPRSSSRSAWSTPVSRCRRISTRASPSPWPIRPRACRWCRCSTRACRARRKAVAVA